MDEPAVEGMRTFWFPAVLTESGWQRDVAIDVDGAGIVRRMSAGSPRCGTAMDFVALPALVNVHSHAFQRGMAGLTEFRTEGRDSFWTWRRQMYEFVMRLTPEGVFAIARHLYLEMLSAGYAWVGEFHYLHHAGGDETGRPGQAMAEAHLVAAREAGLGICLLPVLYQRGGFRDEALTPAQARFRMETDDLVRLVERLHSDFHGPACRIGMALHSLRAVAMEPARHAVGALESIAPGLPVHIHVAEQEGEVDECLAVHRQRPVERLMEQLPVDQNWCLIHATHVDSREIQRVIQSGATVGLCPTTEANLGDGYFPAAAFLEAGGGFAIGSDSHCCVDWGEELRTLEYGERLQKRQRAVLSGPAGESVGRWLLEQAARGGGRAIGIPTGRIAPGCRADWMLVDPDHPAVGGAEGDRLIDRLVFFSHRSPACGPVRAMVVGGVLTEFDGAFAGRLAGSGAAMREAVQQVLQSGQ